MQGVSNLENTLLHVILSRSPERSEGSAKDLLAI